MLPSIGYQGFRTSPIPSGWVQMGERWALWWNGREVASVTPASEGGYRLNLNALKMWQTKNALVASTLRLTDSTSIEPRGPLLGLSPTREQQQQQQTQRLDAAAAAASARVMVALGSQRPPIR